MICKTIVVSPNTEDMVLNCVDFIEEYRNGGGVGFDLTKLDKEQQKNFMKLIENIVQEIKNIV